MPDLPVVGRPRTKLFCAALVSAPLLMTIELLISPLANGTSPQDLAAIRNAPNMFIVSVVIGTLGTFLLLPGLLGLAHRCSARSPRLAAACAVLLALQVLGFSGVRALQGAQLGLARSSLSIPDAARIWDATTTSPICLVFGVSFLGLGTLGWVLTGVALWRSRAVPVPAVVLFWAFPVADWLAPTQALDGVAHLVLIASFAWMAWGFLRATPLPRTRAVEDPEPLAVH